VPTKIGNCPVHARKEEGPWGAARFTPSRSSPRAQEGRDFVSACELVNQTIIVPMIPFAFNTRKIGRIRFTAGWVPPASEVIAINHHGAKLAIPLPSVSVVDNLSTYEYTQPERERLWRRLIKDELPNERFRAGQVFKRNLDEDLCSLIEVTLGFFDFDHAYNEVIAGRETPPFETGRSCDMSEQCVGALIMLALQKAG